MAHGVDLVSVTKGYPEREGGSRTIIESISFTVAGGETTFLSGVHDMERLMARIVYGTANAKELRALS